MTDPRLAACLLILTAVSWGSFTRGAFYQFGLAVFVALAAAAAGAAAVLRRARLPVRWWLLSAAAPAAAIAVSAAARHESWALWYALAPVIAAAGLGLAGSAAARLPDRLLILRLVADVALVTAALCWLGVAWHITALAQPLTSGWRATGPIGYPNVTGLLLLLGLLCGCVVAARSGRSADLLRCCLLATGVLATQSRSVVVAAVICAILLRRLAPGAGRAMIRSSWCGLVAFTGLLPSILGLAYGGLLAAAALAVALILAPLTASARLRPLPHRRLLALGGAAAGGLAAVSLHGRILDAASASGHLRLWLGAAAQLRWSGLLGYGPAQVADLSRGQLVTLLVHDDPLQFALYYGVPGVAAMLLIGWRLARLLARRRGEAAADMWAVALAAAVAVGCAALTDFPLQVPLVPAVTCLIIGAAIGTPETTAIREADECRE